MWYIVTLSREELLLRGEDSGCHPSLGMSEIAWI